MTDTLNDKLPTHGNYAEWTADEFSAVCAKFMENAAIRKDAVTVEGEVVSGLSSPQTLNQALSALDIPLHKLDDAAFLRASCIIAKSSIEAHLAAQSSEIPLIEGHAHAEARGQINSLSAKSTSKMPYGAREFSESDTQSHARGEHHGAALTLLNIMRPGITKDAWDDFLLSRGAWAKGGNAAFMHVSPEEILRIAARFATKREICWVPIKTAPRDGSKIIVINWNGSDPLAHTAWWATLPGCWENPLTNRELKPTHWMPLKRPKEAL